MIRGELKIIHGREGHVTVQETLNGTIRQYSAEKWTEELARRAEADKKERKEHLAKEEAEKKAEAKKPKKAKEEPEVDVKVEEPREKPKAKKKVAPKKKALD